MSNYNPHGVSVENRPLYDLEHECRETQNEIGLYLIQEFGQMKILVEDLEKLLDMGN